MCFASAAGVKPPAADRQKSAGVAGADLGLRSVLARDVIEALGDAILEYEGIESDEPF
mgnify:CR=1 FL=1